MSEEEKKVPSVEHYTIALSNFSAITRNQLSMLQIHYSAPMQTITAAQMAKELGFSRYNIANSQYGRLGRLVGERLPYNPIKQRLGTLVTFDERNNEWHWIMRPQLAKALEILEWVKPSSTVIIPEEIADSVSSTLVEGALTRITVNAYERNLKARQECIQEHGCQCCICGFDFGVKYGKLAEGYIHVHHLRSLSEIRDEYEVDPVADLRPVCPNCHAVIHRRNPPYSIEEVKSMIHKPEKE